MPFDNTLAICYLTRWFAHLRLTSMLLVRPKNILLFQVDILARWPTPGMFGPEHVHLAAQIENLQPEKASCTSHQRTHDQGIVADLPGHSALQQ
jgi:hypothetical protein